MASLTVGRVRGIPIRLHWSFLLILPFFAYLMARAYFTPPDGLMPTPLGWFWGALLAVGLFTSVLLHELAHSITAQREGVGVRHITLLPIGGVSAFEEIPKDPMAEFRITIYGPITNFVIGLPLLALWYWAPIPDAGPGLVGFIFWLGALNLLLGAFNLFIPAFPMDGGRILRALLSHRLGRVQATRWAAGVGRVLAVAMGVWGFLTFAIGGWLLLLIAFFIYLGANEEERGIRVSEALEGFRVKDIMTPHVDTLHPGESVERAFARMLETKHLALPVVQENSPGERADREPILGVVHLTDLQQVPETERWHSHVDRLAHADVPTIEPDVDATELLRVFSGQARPEPVLVVDRDGRLAGIVTPTDITRFVQIVNAASLRGRPGRGPAGGGLAG